MKPSELLDQARKASGLPSDYAIAKRLEVTPQAVSNWRKNRKFPGMLEVFGLAQLAGMNPAEVIAQLEIERAEIAGRIDQASTWRGLVQRLAGAATVAGVVLLSAAPAPAAAAGKAARSEPSSSVYYVNKRRRRAWLQCPTKDRYLHSPASMADTRCFAVV